MTSCWTASHVRALCHTACLSVLLVALAHPACAQRFLPDDPLWSDPDRMSIAAPTPRSTDASVSPMELLTFTFGKPGEHRGPAVNVNTLGEVPNSSWYTNRHYWHRMSPDALARGPNRGTPPDTSAAWRVTGLTAQHGLQRATIVDAQERQYRLLFDASDAPELATGAAMIASRLLHALGYYVPEHYLRRIRPGQLRAHPDSGVARSDVWRLFNSAAPGPDGTYRVLATRMPDAERPIGPFRFYGTRPDDPNDIFPHESRRELRGLRIVAAWMNHSKISEAHTLAALVRDGERQYVRHYLTDLSVTLGSAGDAPKAPWSGHEHTLELGSVFKRVGTLGMAGGRWMNATTPDLRGVGHFEAEFFDPSAWKPELPNPAFERCDAMDAFWAARQIAAFTRADLRAIVNTARYSDSDAAAYLTETLAARRDTIAQTYLGVAGGLDRFAVDGRELVFRDLRARHGLAPDSVERTVVWHVFDNERARTTRQLTRLRTAEERIPLPPSRAPFLQVSIRTPGRGQTVAYLRRTTSETGAPGYAVVGLDRTAAP